MLSLDVQYYKAIAVPQPAAGAEWTMAAPGHATWRIVGLRYTLVTDANVANRVSTLIVDDQTDSLLQIPAGAVQAAGATQIYAGYAGSPSASLATAPWLLPCPSDGLVLLPGFRLRSSTVAIQVGDQYGAIRLYVEEYPNGPDTRRLPTVDSFVTGRA